MSAPEQTATDREVTDGDTRVAGAGWGQRSAPVSSRAAAAVTVVFALVVAAVVDGVGIAAVGPVGAVAFGWGVAAATSDRKRRVAAGSVALVLGSAALAVAAVRSLSGGLGGFAFVVAGTGVVAIAAWNGFADDARSRLKRCLAESGFLSVAAFVAFSLAFLLFATGLAGAAAAWLAAVSTASPLAALAWLQAGLLAVGLLARRAAAVVEEWAPGDRAPTDGLAAQFMLRADDVPWWYVAVLLGQFVVAALVPGLSDPYVSARPLLDRTVDLLLLSGSAQAALAGLAVALGVVAVAPAVRRAVVFWTGTAPGYTLAFGAGGAATIACSLAVGALASLGLVASWLVPAVAAGSAVAAFGPAVPVLAGMFGALIATVMTARWLDAFVAWAEPTGGAFAVGAAALFAGTLLLAGALPAVVVVVGTAVALFVWDAGVHATTLSRDLDGATPSTRTEVVHAVGAGGALLGGVVVATAVGYFAVPLPVPAGRATVALALALAALVAFAFAVRR